MTRGLAETQDDSKDEAKDTKAKNRKGHLESSNYCCSFASCVIMELFKKSDLMLRISILSKLSITSERRKKQNVKAVRLRLGLFAA